MTEYNYQIQKLFLEFMISDSTSFVRVQNIYNIINFDEKLQPVAKFLEDHSNDFSTLPDPTQIKAVTGIEINPLPDSLNGGHTDWFLDEFEKFTQRQELERAILTSAELLDKGDFAPVEKLIKDAVQISLTKDMGTDYFDNPRARLKSIRENNGQTSTGWPSLDKLLYGGFNRGELNIFAGASGSGKSLFMQNLSINWLEQGLNGVFITLELSEDLSSMRVDSMITGKGTRDLFKNLDDVEKIINTKAKKMGEFQIKYLPSQSTVNDVRSYIKEFQIKNNRKIDFVCADYLDLFMPVSVKVNPSDVFIKDKYVSEELRNLAKELDIIFVTASQLNRSATEEVDFDHSHIAGGISKINTADNVFGIFTSRAMRERGRYQLQAMKTRSSSGVGSNIDLDFNVDSMRITDPGLSEQGRDNSSFGNSNSSSIMNSIKNKTTTEGGAGDADIQSAKLNKLLNKIKS